MQYTNVLKTCKLEILSSPEKSFRFGVTIIDGQKEKVSTFWPLNS